MLEEKKRAADRPQLSAVKRALLQKLLEGKGRESADPDRISRRARPHEPAPLSFAQQRLWFLDRLEPNSHFYNVPTTFGIAGALNIAALQQSIDAILLRHESLRSIFIEVDGQPMQTATPYSSLPIKHVDLRSCAATARESELQRHMTEEFQQPFDLAKGPLFRPMLARLDDEQYVLLLTMHHIVTDDWSMGILFRELAASYQSFTEGAPAALPEDGVQYADYAVWQRQRLSPVALDKQLAYWKDKLRGVPTILKLPTDRPRPPVQSYQGDDIPFTLTETLTAQLNEFSRKQGVTLFMTLLAAFEVLLYRYSAQEQFCIGTPLANRTRPEVENLIGFFVNTLVLRADLSGDPTFIRHLANVREASLEAQSHQDIPFEKLLDELQPARDLAHSPLFQVLFVLHNVPRDGIRISGLQFYPVDMKEKSARFDLCLDMTERGGRLSGEFQYSTALFDGETIALMVDHYRTLLESIVACPQLRISELPMLTGTELQQVVKDWNATATDYPSTRTIPRLFEAQAACTPAAVAVEFEDQHYTYAELSARTDQLARYLRQRGVGSDVLVGVCMERSLDMVVSLLGIMKAGGAYVPIDPDYPAERIAFMLEDAAPALLLTQHHLAARLPDNGTTTICLDKDWGDIACLPDRLSVPEPLLQQLAYTIYTSGSTGRPKGAGNTHGGLLNRLQWMQEYFALTAEDRILQKTPFSFDVSVWEFFWPLIVGARLVIARPGDHKDGERLIEVLRRQRVTTVHFVPPMLRAFLETPGAERCSSLRRIICSGEALPADLARQCHERLPDAELYNLYGPTEASIDVTAWACERLSRESSVPIGKPIANTQIYLLDRNGHPVPAGMPGELYIGGVGLARGYHRRAGLTAEKFVPDAFGGMPGSRLYRTGDLARFRPDGAIEYLGRLDHQVKIRGFRIELGEIEAQLTAHPTVRDAVVLAREDQAGKKRIVAYVISSADAVPSPETLREFLASRLPEYMVPAVVMVLDAWPLTSNGKVDSKALPIPDAGSQSAKQYRAPQTQTEEALAKIWEKVLGVKQVGVDDNFFELGGDSILCLQVVARAREAGLMLRPRQLFQHQTISALATAVEYTTGVWPEQGIVGGDVPLSPIQHRFFAQDLPNPHYYNQTVLLAVRAGVDLRRLERAVQAVLAQHDAFRLRFTPEAGGWRQAYGAAAEAVEWVDLAGLPAAEQAQALEAAAIERQAGLHLTTGPVARAVLFTRGAEETARLLLVIHHLVVDGISWRILLDDLMTAYQGLATQETVRLPASSSFQAWATRLQAYSQSAALQAEAEYWLAAEPAAVFPVEDPQGAATEADAALVTVSLDAETTRQLVQEVPAAARLQLQDVLLAALVQVLSEWSGGAVVQFDLEGHGREELFPELDVSRTVGWFTTVFPVAVRVEPGAPPGTVLAAVKDGVRRLPHKGIGYGLLRYGSGDPAVRRRLAAQPASPVSFNYLGQFDQTFPAEAPVRPAPESVGPNQDARSRLPYELDINANILDGQLQVLWGYSGRRYRRATIDGLGARYIQALRTLIAHCLAGEAGGYTPGDFPDVELSPDLLDHILEEIE